MRRSFVYKARLSPSAKRNAERQLALCCELHNAAIEERREAWKQGKSVGYFAQSSQLTHIKAIRPEFKEIGSQVLQNVLRRVDLAFRAFYRRVQSGRAPGYPRFKSSRRYDSITFSQKCWKLDGKRLTMQGIGTVKLILSRPIEGRIKTVTLRRDSCCDWWVCFSCDNVSAQPLESTGAEVGIDLGLNAFIATSDGGTVDPPKPYRAATAKRARLQRSISKQKRGGFNRRKRGIILARQHRRVARIRKDFHYKTAHALVERYDLIAVEDLNIKGLARTRLAKSIHDAGWGEFTTILRDKAEKAGRVVVGVNPKGTSQMCSVCGSTPEVRKTLSVRVHKCECGYEADRDVNAARNILALATGEARLLASSPAIKAAA